MSEKFLHKIPSEYLEANRSYHRKTWPAKFVVTPCTDAQIQKTRKDKNLPQSMGIDFYLGFWSSRKIRSRNQDKNSDFLHLVKHECLAFSLHQQALFKTENNINLLVSHETFIGKWRMTNQQKTFYGNHTFSQVLLKYTASQKHESTLLHTYVLNEFLTANC